MVDKVRKSLFQSFTFFKLHICPQHLEVWKYWGAVVYHPKGKVLPVSRPRCGSFAWMEARTSNDTVQEKIQFDCLRKKKNSESSSMLTGVWPGEYSWTQLKPCPITLLAKFCCTSPSSRSNLITSLCSFPVSVTLSLYDFMSLRRGTCLKQL